MIFKLHPLLYNMYNKLKKRILPSQFRSISHSNSPNSALFFFFQFLFKTDAGYAETVKKHIFSIRFFLYYIVLFFIVVPASTFRSVAALHIHSKIQRPRGR